MFTFIILNVDICPCKYSRLKLSVYFHEKCENDYQCSNTVEDAICRKMASYKNNIPSPKLPAGGKALLR